MILIAMGLFAVIGVALFVLGIFYLRSLDVTTATIVISLVIILLLSLVTYFAVGPIPLDSLLSLTSVPFGSAVRFLLLSAGLPTLIAYLAGFIVNFGALVGAVRWIEKRIGK